jgi:putative heme-binding domain-containing protein
VPAYLTGMAAKSPELRAAGRTALAAVRDKAAPVLEELAKRRELPAGALPELRTVFAGPAPVLKWRVVGPFPKDTKAVAADKAPDLAAALPGKGVVEVRWREVTADAGQNGRINLAGLYNGATDAAAYAFAEVESPADRDAEVAVGSDDGVTVWVNGKQVHQWVGNRAWTPAQDRVTVKLTKGTNRLLVRCYNDGGPWDMSAAISGDGSAYRFLQGAGEKLDLSAYRDFARKNKGDAERGGRLFADLKGVACIKCHAVGGAGGLVGPAMDGVGLKYNREELMTSILEPSKTIAQGYETVTVVTTAGKPYVGVFKGETGEALTLADAEGKTVSVPKKDIDERAFSPVSTMPNRLNEGMTLQDFADLVSYLEARREEKTPPKK